MASEKKFLAHNRCSHSRVKVLEHVRAPLRESREKLTYLGYDETMGIKIELRKATDSVLKPWSRGRRISLQVRRYLSLW